jgi:hypothetical protein
LVSQLREDLLLCSSYLPLGIPNGLLLTSHQAIFLALLPGERRFLQGESRTHNLLLCYFLLYFIFACIFLSKIQKK